MRAGGVSRGILAKSKSISPLLLLSATALLACGDPPECAGPVAIGFEPTTVATDLDAAAPGVQTQIAVGTNNLAAGEAVSLDIVDASGATTATVSATVDDAGRAVFAALTVPPPSATLRATARGLCGIARAERALDVSGSECVVSLDPAPTANAFYAPRGVLNEDSDPDPAKPGYQTTLHIATVPGWTAELFETTPAAGGGDLEHSLGVYNVDAAGARAIAVTMLDGPVAFRAVCRGAGIERASAPLPLLADTTPPTCAQTAPYAGATITPAFDANHDLSDGIQLALSGHTSAGDAVGEQATWTAAASLGAAIVDGNGDATLATTLPAANATYDIAMTLRDHAANACVARASYDVVVDGCDIAVTAPLAVVTTDADGVPSNGAQVDISLQVSPACAQRLVSATCGFSAPSGFAGLDGKLGLRAQLCTSSPCHARALCTFAVTRSNGATTRAVAPIEIDTRAL